MPFPDPTLSANLYASDHLDGVLYRVVAPVWKQLRDHEAARGAHLWVMRYARGGEHLKLRLHAGEPLVREFRQRLAETAASYFEALGEVEPDGPRRSRPDAPPIDAEDMVEGVHPDRRLLWTRYRRSALSLGGPPWLGDDRYVSLLTRCLARGTELLLDIEPEDDELPHRLRQSTLLKGLVLGLGSLGWASESRLTYLAYHRNWLLRHPALKSTDGDATLAEAVLRFDLQARKLGTYLATLGGAVDEEWTPGAVVEGEAPAQTRWKRSLADLVSYAGGFRDDPDHHLDPFAPDPPFVPLFKALHGFANQIGLDPVNEAFAHHLLLRAAGLDSDGDHVPLLPELGDPPPSGSELAPPGDSTA